MSKPSLSAVHLDADQTRHARSVLRLQVGDHVELFNGTGLLATAKIANDEKKMLLHLQQTQQVEPISPVLDFAVCLPKGPRGDQMINQLSQLGVTRLIPLRSQRSVVDPRPGKIERYRKAAIESAKQAGRAHLMTIDPPADFAATVELDYDIKLIADPAGEAHNPLSPEAKRLLVLIGPEGGWSDPERQLAVQAGCIAWSFAPHILRIETAAVAAAGILRCLGSRV